MTRAGRPGRTWSSGRNARPVRGRGRQPRPPGVHHGGVDAGDVALDPGQGPGAFDQVPVHAGEGDEAVLLQRAFAGGDLFGASGHGVDRAIVVLGAFERVVAGHSPVPRLLPGPMRRVVSIVAPSAR